MINNYLIKIVLWLLFQSITCLIFAQENLSVMTYNIRYDSPNDGLDQWDNRKKILTDQIQFYAPTILGIQEGLLHQIEYIKETLKDYEYLGVGRDDGEKKGEYCALFYNKKQLTTKQIGTFWLSQTPEIPSKDWDAALPRICTYALFSSGKNEFWVFNTHFDHLGRIARLASSKLILTEMARINKQNHAAILMGDFNALEHEPPIQWITKKYLDSRYSAHHFFGGTSTFNGFNIAPEKNKRIDFIFHNEQLISTKTAIISQLIEQHYPSDHFPVISYFIFDEAKK
jgi:endonuclease/exonuclease/phosphatase family metal-dependent hydrolase